MGSTMSARNELDAVHQAEIEARAAKNWHDYCRYFNNALAYWLAEYERF